MATTIAPPEVSRKPRAVRDGGRPPGSGRNGYRGGDPQPPPSSRSYDTARLGMWIALAPIVMMFAALTSSLIFRQGFSSDWQPIRMPGLVWVNTVVLLASSATFELARRALSRNRNHPFQRWMVLTTFLGAGFLSGQFQVWRELAGKGVYMASSPNSSFFYLLTGAHGVHLLGGVLGLLYIVSGALRFPFSSHRRTAVDVTAIYWHFMDGLWVYLLLLLALWR